MQRTCSVIEQQKMAGKQVAEIRDLRLPTERRSSAERAPFLHPSCPGLRYINADHISSSSLFRNPNDKIKMAEHTHHGDIAHHENTASTAHEQEHSGHGSHHQHNHRHRGHGHGEHQHQEGHGDHGHGHHGHHHGHHSHGLKAGAEGEGHRHSHHHNDQWSGDDYLKQPGL